MKFRLVCVGRITETWLQAGIDEYTNRVRRYLPLETVELKEEKGGKGTDPRYLLPREGARILGKTSPAAFAIVLDEKGERLGSEMLAELLNRHMVRGTPELAWILGGPYGLDDTVRERGDLLLSLSPMTFTHQMARLVLLEQIYRGLTILRNEPYHNR